MYQQYVSYDKKKTMHISIKTVDHINFQPVTPITYLPLEAIHLPLVNSKWQYDLTKLNHLLTNWTQG